MYLPTELSLALKCIFMMCIIFLRSFHGKHRCLPLNLTNYLKRYKRRLALQRLNDYITIQYASFFTRKLNLINFVEEINS